MPNLVHKLIKEAPILAPSLRIVATPISNTATKSDSTNINPSVPIPLLNPILDLKPPPNESNPFQFYSYPHNFMFGFRLNLVSTPGFCPAKEDVATDRTSDDARTVWADSVKKKRKKKMNKHKYKKLRKRLRRKARRSSS